MSPGRIHVHLNQHFFFHQRRPPVEHRGIMDPLLLVDEDHLEEVWAMAIIAKTCLKAPSHRAAPRHATCYVPWRAPCAWCASAPPGPARCGGSCGARRPGAHGSHLVQTPYAMALDWRHLRRSYGSGGEALFMFSFKIVLAMDVALQLAATLDEDGILL